MVGWNQGSIARCYATGAVTGINEVSGLAGVNADYGIITESYATGKVTGHDYIGGLVGANARNAIIINSYATGTVSGNHSVGGLIGTNYDSAVVTSSYATGAVSGTGTNTRGLVGSSWGGAVVSDSYWDTETSGRTSSAGGVGKTTAQLQTPTNNTGIYATWDEAVWDFGGPNQYPLLRNVGTGVLVMGEDYDEDDDGLIEISNLAQLDAIRYDLDGDGLTEIANLVVTIIYDVAFPDAMADMGCPSSGCTGYELTAHLDFDTNGNGWIDAGDAYWNDGQGWLPIGNSSDPFTATFDGGGYTIANLHINRSRSYVGLFGAAGDSAVIRRVGLVSGSVSGDSRVGSLAGYNSGAIADGYAAVDVSGRLDSVGGLVGYNAGTITGSHATGNVTGGSRGNSGTASLDGDRHTGGLVGWNYGGSITASYATGNVYGNDHVGGLVGSNTNGGAITASYAAGAASSDGGPSAASNPDEVGGLVGSNHGGTIDASYATGDVSSGDYRSIGGLVGLHVSGSITGTYATGAVSGSGDYVGGLIGRILGGTADTAGYWDTDTSGWPTSAGGVGKTTAQLQMPTSNTGIYSTWDEAVWDFGGPNQYPTLRNVGASMPAALSSVPQLYWVDEEAQKIQRTAAGDYRRVEDQLTAAQGLNMPGSIALDLDAGKVYWTDDGAGAIRRANLDGSNVETVKDGLPDPVGIALDLDTGHLYWADRSEGNIRRSSLGDVSNPGPTTTTTADPQDDPMCDSVLAAFLPQCSSSAATPAVPVPPFVAGLTKPYQIALDTANGHIYWTERGENTSKIRRADLDDRNVTDIVFEYPKTAPQNPYGLALDLIAGKMYWTERLTGLNGGDQIRRANLNGQNGEVIVNSQRRSLSGIAVDMVAGKIYWTDESAGAIRRANLDGSLIEEVAAGLSVPEGIAIAAASHPDWLPLVALYHATKGENWTYNDKWLSDAPIGDWHGVATDDSGRVTALSLNYNRLNGELPSELGDLANLARLSLAGNQLTGTIPAELGSLTNLTVLSLNKNKLSGTIPDELSSSPLLGGRLTKLRWLNLEHNLLTGTIPASLGTLSNLEGLSLGDNKLSGEIPDALGGLANLRLLYLDNQSPFRGLWGSYLAPAVVEEYSNNDSYWLHGNVPADLGNLRKLEVLNLRTNRLTGEIHHVHSKPAAPDETRLSIAVKSQRLVWLGYPRRL